MDELFGLSMNTIMYVLLVLLGFAFLTLGYVALTNRIMFKMGLRNIPRRRAQTTLIVIGLMLSTLIISAAFTTGDTVDRSMTSQVYSVLGNLDEVVELSPATSDDFEDPTLAVLREQTFPQTTGAQIANAITDGSDVIEYAVPAYSGLAVGINIEERLSTPEFNIVGLDPSFSSKVTDIQTLGGDRLSITDLGANELYLNESAADDMNAEAGSEIVVAVGDKITMFKVKEIVKDKRFAGAGGISVRREGAVMPLTSAQQLFNAPDLVTMVMVSNVGDARGGFKHVDQARTDIEAAIAPIQGSNPALTGLGVTEIKKTGVEIAEVAANLLTSIFLIFGLFSIGAGILLIFLIFVMLAAERKSEMGMARAIGSKRRDIVETFLAEGMAYNVLSAAVGCFFGVLVSFIISKVMSSLFASLDIDITPHVTARSLIISYCLGVVLTFFTVFFSSWRISNINIVRAIRDIPEPPAEQAMWGQRGLLSIIRDIFFRPTDRSGWLRRLGAVVVAVLVAVSFAIPPVWLIALAGMIALYVRLPKPFDLPWGILAVLWRIVCAPFRWAAEVLGIFQVGPLLVIIGAVMTAQGASMGEESFSAFFLLAGLSFLPLGLAFVARSMGANPRIAYTLVGVFLIYIWELDTPLYKLAESVFGDMKSDSLVTRIFGETSGDFEMFFLSGVMVTLAATFLVVYNADIILGPLTRLGKGLGALLPTLKMAIAYPLANRSRTGMTMAMFCLVVFALTVMSSLSHNFAKTALSSDSQGGFDIQVEEHPQAPLGDLTATLRSLNADVVNDLEAVGITSIATRFRAVACEHRADNSCQQTLVAEDGFDAYSVLGEDNAFLDTSRIKLVSRAAGYANGSAVWQALKNEPNTAIVDIGALSSQGFGQGFIKQIDGTEATFQPVTLTLMDRTTGKKTDVKVIGVIDQNSSALFTGIHVSDTTFSSVFGQPDVHNFFVSTVPGTNNKQAAEQIESALLETGAQAKSLHEILKEFTAIQTGFFRLIQGFMGLGLVVGVAAVGVIAFRTVVERRQQIGMLRAIGYTRRMVGLTFLIESAFIAFMGIISGVVFALILAWQLITEAFSTDGQSVSFSIPWLQLLVIVGLAFVFTLIMTLVPARQAARIPIAEALRYE